MTVISMETAHRIWSAHREIVVATTLHAQMKKELELGGDPTPLDEFGRRRRFQLGVPSGDSGHRLLDVSPQLAFHIIEAHIANKQAELAEACIVAKIDLAGGTTKADAANVTDGSVPAKETARA